MTRVPIPEGMVHKQVEMCANCRKWRCSQCGGVYGFADPEKIDKRLEAEMEAADREEELAECPHLRDIPATFEDFLLTETELDGKVKTMKEWCWQRGLSAHTLYAMVQDGSPIKGLLIVRSNNIKGFSCPVLHKYNGEDYCVAAIAELEGFSKQVLQRTMHNFNMTAEEAVEHLRKWKRTHTKNGREKRE